MAERRRSPEPSALRLATDPDPLHDGALGRDLAAVVMGLDRLERRLHQGAGPLGGEGLVPIWIGDDLVAVAPFTAWTEADAALADLAERVGGLAAGPRRQALEAVVSSAQAASELFQGGALGYAARLERLVQVPAAPVDADVFRTLQEELELALAASGFRSGTLRARVQRWEAERVLDQARLASTFVELLAEARVRTEARVAPVGDTTMALHPVRGVPYSARCSFDEGRMDLNVDLGVTRAGLKNLVAHEVFPGHATQLLYTRAAVAAGRACADVLLCTMNGATGAVQEGIGERATALIDWIEDADDRVQAALRRLQTAAQASAGWFAMEGGWDDARVVDWLRREACGQDAWAEGRLRFAQHPFRGPFIASYWYGDEAVRVAHERFAAAGHEAFVAFLYGRSHGITSLLGFEPDDHVAA
jgi:hypothetical protein